MKKLKQKLKFIFILVVLIFFGVNTTYSNSIKHSFKLDSNHFSKFYCVKGFLEKEFNMNINAWISSDVGADIGAMVYLPQGEIFISPDIVQRDINLLRFAFAHELGHLMYFRHFPETINDRKNFEFQADLFATLMMKKYNFSIDTVVKYFNSLPYVKSDNHPPPKERARKIYEIYYGIGKS